MQLSFLTTHSQESAAFAMPVFISRILFNLRIYDTTSYTILGNQLMHFFPPLLFSLPFPLVIEYVICHIGRFLTGTCTCHRFCLALIQCWDSCRRPPNTHIYFIRHWRSSINSCHAMVFFILFSALFKVIGKVDLSVLEGVICNLQFT